jgi:hypothetical protein
MALPRLPASIFLLAGGTLPLRRMANPSATDALPARPDENILFAHLLAFRSI